ncbi:bifunctional serine/threonine-protein kinase/formylglycine-generating enzyme family protein [Sphaerospermopsis sp. FACHB-1194]|uniref:bifunctional serine/threonine-protein kinase/formylglycine-generating enzyme family protein n=1 Tax=Sphaerospermopsis sp. FACHB-1194 TaxID=2692862 RepID=UPI001680AD30|nr:bifunctional serine/threonine-protein kinase/formylglycine-generating enzyme family protein [Sphaerospermopsis sp. FACHB-1194]MBD2144873.1 SUMF1/EgtB/PvdO family nonheme iron enzyme [Sphaerospermopsis sp. FACHB-1194]
MNQICCLNPDCHNPTVADTTKFCPSCGIPLVILRNHYRPVKPLGGGGFGKTYLAEDTDKFNENCVIKQLAPQTQNTYALKKATELFEEEAKRLQQLQHPQIPRLQAYFEENGYLYLIQDFIDGENLLIELANGETFDERKIRKLLLEILPVLQIVHNQKIIHRDIKPENIMRRRSDGKLFLIDFGASKQLQGTMRPGTIIGSYGYASLEQMEDREVYPASDLFSLGASCFHLMTRVHPWNLWKTQGYGWVEKWRVHLQQPVSVELGKILDKLLQTEYQNRYQSSDKLLQVLQTPPPPPPQPPQPPQPPISQKLGSSQNQSSQNQSFQKSGSSQNQSFQNQSSQPTIITRRNFLVYPSLFVGGVTIAVVGQNLFFPSPKNQTSENQTSSNSLSTFNFEVVTTDSTGSIINRRNSSARYFTEDLGNGVTLEMVEIPGGTFLMGSPQTEKDRASNEGPQRQVTVPSFFMGKYPLTQKQYQAIMGYNPSDFKGDSSTSLTNQRPVEEVSWNDAVKFCQRLSQKTGKTYRLPSEAEWEYACRAGTTTPFYFGENITPDLVNYNGNYPYGSAPKGIYREQTTDVGSFPPNAFGLYDMHGNVWEWCLDNQVDNYNNAPTDGSAVTSQSGRKVLRGGSWFGSPRGCRSAFRGDDDPEGSSHYQGFRLVVAGARTL